MNAGAEDFPYPDLFCLLLSHEGDQAVEAETTDEDGNPRKDPDQPEGRGILAVETGDAFVEELGGVHVFGVSIVPYLLIGRQYGTQIAEIDTGGAIAIPFSRKAITIGRS